MQRSYVIRDFRSNDAEEVNRVALAAFAEFKDAYSDWSAFSQNIDKRLRWRKLANTHRRDNG